MIKTLLIALAACGVVVILVFVVSLLRLRGDVASYKTYWQERADLSAKEDAFVYVALGDSAAQGIGASKPEKGYVGLLAEYLGEKTGKEVHVINLSVSGAKISDVTTKQLPELAKLNVKPDLLTVEIGANNVPSYNKDKFTAEFSQLLMLLPKDAVVANVPSFRHSRLNKLALVSDEANEIATSQIKATGFILVDINTATNNLGLSDYAADYFHPSDQSYKEKWAPAFVEAIESDKSL